MLCSEKLLIAGSLLCCLSAPAYAADGQSKRDFYIGVQAGEQQIHDHFHGYWKSDSITDFDLGKYRGTGLVGGFHAGYEHRTATVIAGVEMDVEGAGATVDDVQNNWNWTAKTRWQTSFRARVGVTPGQMQIYATGGLTLAKIDHRYVNLDPTSGEDYRASKAKIGFTVGGGVGYHLDDRLVGRIEYRYSDYGTIVGEAHPAWQEIELHGVKIHGVRVGLSYRLR